MAIFLTQGRFTRDYIKSGLAKPEDRQEVMSRICEQAGGRLVQLYITSGESDFLVISEMPDLESAAALALVASGGGAIENATTTQAWTTSEAKALFERASKITGYRMMGG